MDRRHGKRPLPPETSEEKSKGRDDFGAATATSWPEFADMAAMVTAFTQVKGSDEQLGFPQSSPSSTKSAVKQDPDPPQPAVQDQGTYLYTYLFDYNNYLFN